jgi:uncharacterized protein involved in exopolysaccharide biosynthesis
MTISEPAFVPLLRVLWQSRWIIVVTGFLFTVAFGVYAFVATKVYRSEAVLSVVENDDKGGALASMLDKVGGLAALAGAFQPGGQSDEAIFVLRSRSLGEQFIQEEGLIQAIYSDQWDAKAKAWKSDVDKPPTIQDAYRVFDKKIRDVAVDQKTGLVTLTIRWRDPAVAQRWAARLVAMVNQKMRQRDIAEANENLAFLDKELKQTTVVDIQQAIYRLIEAQTRRKMMANVREEYSFKIIDPPIAADANKFESPRKMLLVLLGGTLGFIFGCLIVAGLRARESLRS